MIDLIKELNNELEKFKKEFYYYITDTNIPLDERWKAFCEAPISIKNTKGWIEDFNSINIDWFHDYHYDRYTTIVLSNVIDSMLEAEEPNLELIKVFQEEILTKNLHSFVMDW